MGNSYKEKKYEIHGGQGMTPWPYCHLGTASNINYEIEYARLYPNIYFILQPYISDACNQIEKNNQFIPDSELISYLSDCICSDIIKKYPEIDCDNCKANMDADVESTQFRKFQRRGLFFDLVQILLINELLTRR